MNIQVSEKAAEWYKDEYNVEEAAFRFFVRYGGMGGHIPGFSLGINLENPVKMHTSTTINGLQFFVEESDVWYFEDKDLFITFDEQQNEPHFAYE